MDLSERKKKILSAVVDENIMSAEPVSSGQLQKNHLSEFSSATIRNELAMLEELGYLYQPHTSAGRLPTAEGLRFYVEQILPSIKVRQLENIVSEFDANLDNISKMLSGTARAISEATNYTSIMYLGLYDFAQIEKVGLVKLDEDKALAVIATDRGLVKDVIDLEGSVQELNQSAKMLTEIFKGKTLRQIENSDFIISQEMSKYKMLFDLLVEMVAHQDELRQPIAIEGKDKIFNYPEFTSVDKVKDVFEMFDDPSKIYPLLGENDDFEVSVEIGDEGRGLNNCAIVSASYKVGGKTVGKAGVMGPARMDYKNVISILKGIAQGISQKLENEKGDKDE